MLYFLFLLFLYKSVVLVVCGEKVPIKSGVFRLSPDNQTDDRLDNKTATGTDFSL